MGCNRNKVIAIGNIMMADDGIGIWVAKALKDYLIEKDVELIIGETDVEYCLDSLEDGDNVIILDASFKGGEIGRVSTHSLDEIGYRGIGLTQHNNNLLEAIKLYRRNVKGMLVEIEVADVSLNFGISDTMNLLFSEVVEETKKILESHIGGGKMHDTAILGKISRQLERLCRENKIIRLREVVVEVDSSSYVNNESLKSYLKEYNIPLVGDFTEVIVNIEDYEEETAVILSLKGESVAHQKVHEY